LVVYNKRIDFQKMVIMEGTPQGKAQKEIKTEFHEKDNIMNPVRSSENPP